METLSAGSAEHDKIVNDQAMKEIIHLQLEGHTTM